ncbi:MAG: hypothetical protein HPY73_01370 [Methanomassiliicoccales archaeon]|nr:MAG: hypothetical protein HPY73_01370 [Methanomassiliicoccales archaeon]
MMKNIREIIDKLFINSLEPEFEKPGNEYLSWVLDRIHGEKILDVGSYNNVFSAILYNINKNVDSVPIDASGTDNFLNFIPSYENVQDFFNKLNNNYNFNKSYDTVLVTDPQRWGMSLIDIFKIDSLINDGGKIIITIRFGKFGDDNFYGDYGIDLINLLKNGYELESLDTIGKFIDDFPYFWLCASFVKKSCPMNIDNELTFQRRLNYLIENRESQYVNLLKMKKEKSRNNIQSLNHELIEITKELKNIQDNLYSIYNQIIPAPKSIQNDSDYKDKIESENEVVPFDDYKAEYPSPILNESKILFQIEILKSKLNEAVKLLKSELDEEEKLLKRCNELQRRLERSEQRYSILANSTLGKITLTYWKFLKNMK